MADSSCIFCKIIQKQIPSKIIKENEHVLVMEDIRPKAPIHYLILPKKHVINVNYLKDEDSQIAWEVLKMARDVAKDIQEKSGQEDKLDFNLISNNGSGAGQSVFHMHWHFISGKNLKEVIKTLE